VAFCDSLLSLLFSVLFDSAKNLGVVFIPDEGSGELRVSLSLSKDRRLTEGSE